MGSHSFCEQLTITDEELTKRRSFLGLTDQDHERLATIRTLLEKEVEGIVEEFYDHFCQFPDLERFLAEPDTVVRLKQTLNTYLLTLGHESHRIEYCENRLRVGFTHERIGLAQKWYLGAYGKLYELLAKRIAKGVAHHPEEGYDLLVTLQKIFTLDEQLAVETYYFSTTQRLEKLLAQVAEAQHNLEEVTRLDGLTQALNHKFLLEALDMEFYRSRRFQHPFTILFLDLDHFKELNDHYGHSFGDKVLKQVAADIRAIIRPSDIVGRYGGEEFVVGLIECNEETGKLIAERIRLKIALDTFEFGTHSAFVTLSIGCVTLRDTNKNLDELIEKADQAMYQAKATGRNQVAVSPA